MSILKLTSATIFKVTSATIGETKRGFKVFKLQLNNTIWATKLFPLKKLDRKYDELYQMYIEHGSLSFIEGKYISVSINQSQYGYQFSSISSFDALEDFKKEVESSRGKAFSTRLPIYDFLLSLGREVEDDGSIKIKSDFGDMRVSKCNSVSVCYTFNSDNKKLNIGNIERIFNKFFEGVDLPVYTLTGDGDGQKSYYKISWQDVGIVRMDNHVKISYRMTTSGDYDKWVAKKVLTIGDDLPDEYVDFLNE